MQLLPPQLWESIVGKHPGRYSGNSEDWPQWRRRWLPFLREVEGLWPGITDAQRLALLRSALDNAGQLLLDQEVEANPETGYEEYWAKVDLEGGAEDKEVLRRKMLRLRVQHAGKVSEKAWREFFAELTTLAAQIGDVSERELGRIAAQALPAHPWRRNLAKEEDRKKEVGTLLLEGLPRDITTAEVTAMVKEETGQAPAVVKKVEKGMKVVPISDEHRAAIKMAYDRQRLAGGHLIKVSPDSVELTGREVNDLMIRWLRVEQRIAAPDTDSHNERRPAPRWQRDVEVAPDPEETDPSVCAVDRAPTPSKAMKRPPTPPKETKKEEAHQAASPPHPIGGACGTCGHVEHPPVPAEQTWGKGGGWGGRGWKGGPKGSSSPSQGEGDHGKATSKGKGKGKGSDGKGKGAASAEWQE